MNYFNKNLKIYASKVYYHIFVSASRYGGFLVTQGRTLPRLVRQGIACFPLIIPGLLRGLGLIGFGSGLISGDYLEDLFRKLA